MNEDRKHLFAAIVASIAARGHADPAAIVREATVLANAAWMTTAEPVIVWRTQPSPVRDSSKINPQRHVGTIVGGRRDGHIICIDPVPSPLVHEDQGWAVSSYSARSLAGDCANRSAYAKHEDLDTLKELLCVFELNTRERERHEEERQKQQYAAFERTLAEQKTEQERMLLPSHEETNPMTKTTDPTETSVPVTASLFQRAFKSVERDVRTGGERATASTLAEQTQKPVLLAMKKAGVPRTGVAWVQARLQTPFGSAAWSYALGLAIPVIPKVNKRPDIQALGDELRTQGFHKAFHHIAKQILDPIGDVLIAFVDGDNGIFVNDK